MLTAAVVEARAEEAVGVLDRRLSTRVESRHHAGRGPGRAAGRGPAPADQVSLSRIARDLADDPPAPEPDVLQGSSRTWRARIGMAVVGSDGSRIGVVDAVLRDAVTLGRRGPGGDATPNSGGVDPRRSTGASRCG